MGNNHKNAMIAMLLGALVVMAVAYAAFSTALTINGTATINSSWNVHFDTTKTSGTGVINPTTLLVQEVQLRHQEQFHILMVNMQVLVQRLDNQVIKLYLL